MEDSLQKRPVILKVSPCHEIQSDMGQCYKRTDYASPQHGAADLWRASNEERPLRGLPVMVVNSRLWIGNEQWHYSDVIVGPLASLITSLTSVYSTVHPGTDQRKHQSSTSLTFARGIHRRPVNSRHKWPVTRKMFPFDDVIMETNSPAIWLAHQKPQHAPTVWVPSQYKGCLSQVWGFPC